MASTETPPTPLLEEPADASVPTPSGQAPGGLTGGAKTGETRGWKPSAVAADIATLGTGALVAGLFNVALVFLVPRLISVEDYGYWRLFALYAAYIGFLHCGFADGASLRWAGRPLQEFHHELLPAIKYLLWQHGAVLLPACALAVVLLRGPIRFVVIGLAIYAPLYNIAATMQFGLQGARDFRPVAISTIAAPALFCVSLLGARSIQPLDFRRVITLFVAAWCVPLAYLIFRTRPWIPAGGAVTARGLGGSCVLSGWPIVLANTAIVVISYADRLAVSWAAPIRDFAQYSLAASAMAVPLTAIGACSKVFFSHLAGIGSEGRKRIYRMSSWLLLIAWIVLLPYYFALDVFIRRFLPKYAPSMHYARILLLAIPFVAVIQILQISYAYLNRRQREFLVRTIAVLGVSLAVTSFAAFHARTYEVVAEIQAAILGAWWLFNEWTLREWTGQKTADWAEFAAIYGLTGVSYWVASGLEIPVAGAIGLYYLAVMVILSLACREKLALLVGVLRRSYGTTVGADGR
jgi:O-antigen/teichoic acid export membrane protein